MDPNKTAYSYIRFSSKPQAEGGSFDRQKDRTEEYAEKHGLTLVEDYHDLAVSAFRGRNARKGRLKDFLDAIKSKKVRPGSTIIVENLDRLSRAEVLESVGILSSILQAGVKVVTLTDGRVWSAESMRANEMEFMFSVMELTRSHRESARKSDFALKAWERARKHASTKKISQNYPTWLELKDNQFKVIKPKASVVQTMFQMYLDGHGTGAIARYLNSKNIPTFTGKKWQQTTIKYYLRFRGVMGEYQAGRRQDGKKVKTDMVVADYYPPIVTHADFARAQVKLSQNKKKQGRPQPEDANLFSGLIRCGYCGGSMGVYNAANTQKHSYVCWNAVSGGCIRVAYPADEIENYTINALDQVRVDWLTRQSDVLKAEELEGQISILDEKLKKLVNLAELGGDIAELADRMKAINADRSKLQDELAEQQALNTITLSDKPMWTGGSTQERLSIIPYLNRHIKAVKVYPAGPQANADKYAQRLKEYAKKGKSGSQVYHTIRNELGIEWARFYTVELNADFHHENKKGRILRFSKTGLETILT